MALDKSGNTCVTEAQSKANDKWKAKQEAKASGVISRQEARKDRWSIDQLAALDERNGFDQGAQKERARLWKQIES